MTHELYLLQYGSFLQLSRAEAYAFIHKNNLGVTWEGPSYLVFEAKSPPDPYFGSIVRMAQRYSSLQGFFERFGEELQYLDKKSVKWSLYDLGGNGSVAARLKTQVSQLIKRGGKKSVYVGPTRLFSEKGGISLTRALRAKLSTEGYEFLLLTEQGGGLSVWRTKKHLDLKGFRERDLGRPYQKPLISMPPWLARSMINLASPSSGGMLLDPFCGTGTILLEALDAGLAVCGVDIDPANAQGAKANIDWYSKKKPLPPASIINADTRQIADRFPAGFFDLVVTEPPFGPPLKAPPNKNEIAAVAGELSELYSASFTAVSSVLKKGAKMVFTLPAWRLRGGGLYELRAEKVLGAAGLTPEKHLGPVDLPIRWSKPDNVIHRLIFVASNEAR